MHCAAVPLHDPQACTEGGLDLGDGHRMHWEVSGHPQGVPLLLLHGGPGSGLSPALRALPDPRRYMAPTLPASRGRCPPSGLSPPWGGPAAGWRIIGFDQRGCGRSTPRGATQANRTALLVADIERLRQHLGLERWLVAGGSWGATLALAYAASHRGAVRGLLLRSLFVPTAAELGWFFQGAADLQPRAWARLASLAPAGARAALLPWLGEVFAGTDSELQRRVAVAWLAWERALSGLPEVEPPAGEALAAAVDRYRVQSHYLAHACWLGAEGMAAAAEAARGLPTEFLHGRADQVCRGQAAWAVHEAMPGSRFTWVEGVGHDPFHPAMVAAFAGALTRLGAT